MLFWEVLKLDQSTLVQRVKCSGHILAATGRVAAQSHGKLAGRHQWPAASALERGEDGLLLLTQAVTHHMTTIRFGRCPIWDGADVATGASRGDRSLNQADHFTNSIGSRDEVDDLAFVDREAVEHLKQQRSAA